jgi:hypothetical protein
MSATIVNLIIQIVAGAIGGNAVGASTSRASLGTAGNTIAGAIGGIGGGWLLGAIVPMLQAAEGGGVDITSIIGQLVGGGVGGAVLTAILAAIRSSMTKG